MNENYDDIFKQIVKVKYNTDIPGKIYLVSRCNECTYKLNKIK